MYEFITLDTKNTRQTKPTQIVGRELQTSDIIFGANAARDSKTHIILVCDDVPCAVASAALDTDIKGR